MRVRSSCSERSRNDYKFIDDDDDDMYRVTRELNKFDVVFHLP